MHTQITYVYRYIDKADNEIKYVGISNNVPLRIKQHNYDEWTFNKTWMIEVLRTDEPLNRTSAMILESHFISLYNTGDYYNINQIHDGLGQFLTDLPESFEWELYKEIKVSKSSTDNSQTDVTVETLKIGNLKILCNTKLLDDDTYEINESSSDEVISKYDEDMIYSFCVELLSVERQFERLFGDFQIEIGNKIVNITQSQLELAELNNLISNLYLRKDIPESTYKLIAEQLDKIHSDCLPLNNDCKNLSCVFDELGNIKVNALSYLHNILILAKERICSNIVLERNSLPEHILADTGFEMDKSCDISDESLRIIHV